MGNAVNADAGPEQEIAKHYASENLEERILAAFEATGKPRSEVTPLDLTAVSEFHIGGSEATEALARQMNLRPGMRILDIGSGIGGPARFIASKYRCHVTGVDLTAEYVRAANALTSRVGLSASAKFEQGSALNLPFEDRAFDAAYMIHVGMNIPDKMKLFGEVKRVLNPNGIFAIYDVMRIGPGDFNFPVPWASARSESFVAPAAEYREGLQQNGFVVVAERERRQSGIDFFEQMGKRARQEGPRPPGLHLVMGESAMTKTENVLDGVRRGVIAPIEIVVLRQA